MCWANLVAPNVNAALNAKLPELRKYPSILGEEASYVALRSWLALIITEVSDFFNVGKNLSKAQIAMTAELIIENYPHFTLADFKCCFRQNMASGKLFDRLDGNIICGWLHEYDTERNAALEKLYEQQDRELYQPPAKDSDAISFDEFEAKIRDRVAADDPEAIKALEYIDAYKSLRDNPSPSSREKELAFRKFYYQYLKSKKDAEKS